jgi:hypothetical protein
MLAQHQRHAVLSVAAAPSEHKNNPATATQSDTTDARRHIEQLAVPARCEAGAAHGLS